MGSLWSLWGGEMLLSWRCCSEVAWMDGGVNSFAGELADIQST